MSVFLRLYTFVVGYARVSVCDNVCMSVSACVSVCMFLTVYMYIIQSCVTGISNMS